MKMKKNEILLPILFLLPAASILLVFQIFPAIYSLYISFFEWDMISSPVFAGLANYITLSHDSDFWKSLLNTFYFAVGTVPTSIVISFLIAYALNRKMRGLAFFRTAYFLPVVTPMSAVTLVWLWIYQPDVGILNVSLECLGISPQKWLLDPSWAMPAVILMSIWKGLGFNVIIFLVGLQNIPRSYFEAAEIDGASWTQVFTNISVPLMTPTIFFVMIVSLIGSFQTFTQVYMLTPDGGPLKSTSVIVFYLYQNAFSYFKAGYASAIAVVVFVVIFILTLIQNKYIGQKVNYDH